MEAGPQQNACHEVFGCTVVGVFFIFFPLQMVGRKFSYRVISKQEVNLKNTPFCLPHTQSRGNIEKEVFGGVKV